MRYRAWITAVAGLCAAAGLAATSARAADSTADLGARVARLEAEVTAAEDIRAIKKLQKTYGYFVDKGMWTDLAEYFTDDAVANYPAGTFIGKPSIREHLYMNVGAVKVGEVGLGDNRLYNHMNIQPVVHLDPGGQTAKGRWRAFASLGSFGGGATWAVGVYEMTYQKVSRVWKIKELDYHSDFGASYAQGWGVLAQPPAGATAAPEPVRRQLAHPADRERNVPCEGFSAACPPDYHYDNPGTGSSGHAWVTPTDVQPGAPLDQFQLRERVATLANRAQLLRAEQDIENLQRIWGFYFERNQWDQAADLFASAGTLEMAQQGVYVGKRRVREYLGSLGRHGLTDGEMSERWELQIVVDVSPDGRTARARGREMALTGVYQQWGKWSEGIYENTFVKQDGVWKIQSLHYYPTFITDYDKGWAKDAQPAAGPSATLPPDHKPTEVYAIFPKAHIPPYHYANPVTGKAPTYPGVERGGPAKPLDVAQLAPPAPRVAGGRSTGSNVAAVLAGAEKEVARFKDYHELENLEGVYGYYLDKNYWNDLANLFSKDGSMELAQRGVYQGRERVRAFLFSVFGRGQEGPVAGRLGNHVQFMPVIHIADDGQSAHIRLHMMQQLGQGGRSSMGGSIYENEAVKEDGVWKFSKVHTMNTFTAAYEGGWARAPGRGVPGPSRELPPDAPPTLVFEMFPNVYDIPYHYANPVTGRTELPQIEKIKFAAPPPPAGGPRAGGPPAGAPASGPPPGPLPMTDAAIKAELRAIGPRIEVQRTTAIYTALLPKEPYANVSVARDVRYGPHERHVIDVFSSADKGRGKPVLVFIHGGGFSRGSKHAPDSAFFDNIGVWAANHGLVGVTINYRLAPEFKFPSGVEDLTRLVKFLKAHAAEYGGVADRIVLWGHSAGAGHVADFIARTAKPGIAGAVLTSGMYTAEDGGKLTTWKDYYGEDTSKAAEVSAVPGLVKSRVPLLVTWAELDPPGFVPDTEKLVKTLEDAGRKPKSVKLMGHSHISETYAIGTADEALSGPVLEFVKGVPRAR